MNEAIRYLTEKHVSEITALALSTLRNYRHQGKGPPYFKLGRSVRYKESDVIRFMEANRIEPWEWKGAILK